MARERQERGEEAKALRLLGDIASRSDPPDAGEAEARYREALALAERLGFRPEMGHGHLGLGRLFRLLGRSDRAEAHLATAGTLFREMGMRVWLEQLDAEAGVASRG